MRSSSKPERTKRRWQLSWKWHGTSRTRPRTGRTARCLPCGRRLSPAGAETNTQPVRTPTSLSGQDPRIEQRSPQPLGRASSAVRQRTSAFLPPCMAHTSAGSLRRRMSVRCLAKQCRRMPRRCWTKTQHKLLSPAPRHRRRRRCHRRQGFGRNPQVRTRTFLARSLGSGKHGRHLTDRKFKR